MPLQEFGTVSDTKEFNSNKDLKKTKFLDLSATSTVRILSDSYYVEDTHYINKSTIRCLGEECPVCNNNRNIIMQNSETFRDDPRYNPKRKVYMVNVYDKTPVRICPNCETENKAGSASACKKCNTIVTANAEPSNKVKVLSRGVTLFDHLSSIRNAVLDAQGEPVGLTSYDITLVVNGSGKDKTITPIPGLPSDKPEFSQEDLFDLDKVVVSLDAMEILELQKGVSLRDIFSARKAKKSQVDFTDSIPDDIKVDVQKEVDNLFGIQ